MGFPSETRADLHRRLGAWYAEVRRDLPWRRTRDPYAVWISEAMLQQTRVEAVLGHYARFLERLPTLQALAAAEEEEVVALWSGLGYYRRARALHAAARVIVERHGGEFPRERAALLALPGVGPYTAGAVLSIAFGQSEPLVDGNVTRVLARLAGLDLAGAALSRAAWDLARALVPGSPGDVEGLAPGAWNQGLMELGALVCTPRSPDCGRCPVAFACRARAEWRAEELPRRTPRRAPVDVGLEVLVVERRGRLLLLRRPSPGRMAGLWEPPTRELVVEGEPALWPAAHAQGLAAEGDELGELSHSITHHRIRAVVRLGSGLPSGREHRWVGAAELAELGLTGLARKVVRRFAQPAGGPR